VAEGFAERWLALREPADARARDAGLAAQLIATMPARPRIVDLGAGTGSLFRWLAPQIARPQRWTLVDGDAALVEASFHTIARWAEWHGLRVSAPNKRVLLVHTPAGAWRVEGLIADLADAPGWLARREADAVAASALLDLVSDIWVEDLADVLRVPFYSTLDLSGAARFLPPITGDAAVARGLRRDQRRDKGFEGAALGPEATRVAAAIFRARGFAVRSAPSSWQLGQAEASLLAELVETHAAAAAPHLPRSAAAVQAWRAARLEALRRGRLRARVPHGDLLALPPGLA